MRDLVREEATRQVKASADAGESSGVQLAERCLRAGLREGTPCRWTPDDDSGAYDTACGHRFTINEGTPAENYMQFCCYCGGALKERKR